MIILILQIYGKDQEIPRLRVFVHRQGHVDERERVYQISIDGFIKSPVFGNGYKNGNAFESEGTNGIGNHSTVLDSLSQFGIIGALPLFLFLLYPWRRARSKGEDWGYIIPFFIMACLNPVIKCFHLMVILFLIIPCMEMIKCDLITNKGKERRRVSLK